MPVGKIWRKANMWRQGALPGECETAATQRVSEQSRQLVNEAQALVRRASHTLDASDELLREKMRQAAAKAGQIFDNARLKVLAGTAQPSEPRPPRTRQ